MINANLLKGSIVAKGLTTERVATKLSIDTATFYRKMNGNSDFYLHEMVDICRLLETNDPMPIFFRLTCENVSKHKRNKTNLHKIFERS